jgi:hypothetical protein
MIIDGVRFHTRPIRVFGDDGLVRMVTFEATVLRELPTVHSPERKALHKALNGRSLTFKVALDGFEFQTGFDKGRLVPEEFWEWLVAFSRFCCRKKFGVRKVVADKDRCAEVIAGV